MSQRHRSRQSPSRRNTLPSWEGVSFPHSLLISTANVAGGATVSISPSATLPPNTGRYVEVDPGTFVSIASGNGVIDGDVLTLKEVARISALQVAATDYN